MHLKLMSQKNFIKLCTALCSKDGRMSKQHVAHLSILRPNLSVDCQPWLAIEDKRRPARLILACAFSLEFRSTHLLYGRRFWCFWRKQPTWNKNLRLRELWPAIIWDLCRLSNELEKSDSEMLQRQLVK